jgi:hypothetical protein
LESTPLYRNIIIMDIMDIMKSKEIGSRAQLKKSKFLYDRQIESDRLNRNFKEYENTSRGPNRKNKCNKKLSRINARSERPIETDNLINCRQVVGSFDLSPCFCLLNLGRPSSG